jgi:hypothetical protein
MLIAQIDTAALSSVIPELELAITDSAWHRILQLATHYCNCLDYSLPSNYMGNTMRAGQYNSNSFASAVLGMSMGVGDFSLNVRGQGSVWSLLWRRGLR